MNINSMYAKYENNPKISSLSTLKSSNFPLFNLPHEQPNIKPVCFPLEILNQMLVSIIIRCIYQIIRQEMGDCTYNDLRGKFGDARALEKKMNNCHEKTEQNQL